MDFLSSPEVICLGEAMGETTQFSGAGNSVVGMHGVRPAQSAPGATFCGFGGDTFNTAVALARLGVRVAYVGRVGNDALGERLLGFACAEGLVTDFLKPVPGFTATYVANIEENGERNFTYTRAGSAGSTLCVEDLDKARIRQAALVVASGVTLAISPSAQETVFQAFRWAREAGVPTAFDLNYRPALWPSVEVARTCFEALLPEIDILLPSVPADTEALIGHTDPRVVIQYYRDLGIPHVVVKAGPVGCFLTIGSAIHYCPAVPQATVLDTTGAGDAFNGGFLAGWLRGEPPEECAQLGVRVAGLQISRPGAAMAMPKWDEIDTLETRNVPAMS